MDILDQPSVRALIDCLGPKNVRLVGGCVRDFILGLPSHDLDACTPLTPKQVMAIIAQQGVFTAYPTGIDHGTLTLIHRPSNQKIEITTLRQDAQTYGRRAQVVFGTSWKTDAARRDFTFNALMLDHEGGLYDFYGGQGDLESGRVRFIGDPQMRLAEDWLRSLRYFRFWGRFGKVKPNDKEQHALRFASQNLTHLSVERIWAELKGLVQTPKAPQAIKMFDELGFADALGLVLQPCAIGQVDPVSAWAGLIENQDGTFLSRMRASKAEQAHFAAVQSALNSQESLFAKQVRFGATATRAAEVLQGRSGDLGKVPEFPLSAKMLLNLGYGEGPELGRVLHTLKERWIACEGQVSPDRLLEDVNKSQT